jgi:hypothetical protein
MATFTKKEIERIKEADTMAAYVKALTPKNREALKKIMNPGKVEKPETLAEYIQRTGCKTEERTSKKGVELIKVYFENGKIAEYEKKHINTITAY